MIAGDTSSWHNSCRVRRQPTTMTSHSSGILSWSWCSRDIIWELASSNHQLRLQSSWYLACCNMWPFPLFLLWLWWIVERSPLAHLPQAYNRGSPAPLCLSRICPVQRQASPSPPHPPPGAPNSAPPSSGPRWRRTSTLRQSADSWRRGCWSSIDQLVVALSSWLLAVPCPPAVDHLSGRNRVKQRQKLGYYYCIWPSRS